MDRSFLPVQYLATSPPPRGHPPGISFLTLQILLNLLLYKLVLDICAISISDGEASNSTVGALPQEELGAAASPGF